MPTPPTTLLAQLPGLRGGEDAVPQLPSPPLLRHWLLESPATPMVGLVVAAIVVFLVLNRSGQGRRALAVSGVLVALAVGIAVLAGIVTTTAETLIARSRDVIDAVAHGDAARAGGFLADDVRLTILQTPSNRSKAQILADVERVMGPGKPYAVKEHGVAAAQAAIDGDDLARTQLRVRVIPDQFEFPTGSWWRLTWRRSSDGEWRITHVEALQIDGLGTGPMQVNW